MRTAYRYSEDIDLTRTTEGPVGPILDRLRAVLEPWMGRGHYDLGEIGPKLTFTIKAEDENSSQPIRVKVEIATRERTAHDGEKSFPFEVKNPWFNGKADIASFSREEILATKLRALLQRDKGRDLVDLAKAVALFEGLDAAHIVELFGKYLSASGQAISRAEAEERMWAKLEDPSFLADVRPLLAADDAEDFDAEAETAAFVTVFTEFIKRIPGHAWAETPAMAKKFNLVEQGDQRDNLRKNSSR
ncbi:nucleotidyl transferase AbiEii/AbiGii toxin family protein (plasmid) [Bradyrhizobium septentrionale]|nr:nucleotidyl transferase AbiEii/AbiGii toxin family protein [Bradyrhizobium septentrionale]UGY11950.1 nucleotidyl transferase AbiEii/AbiGii toxin family protein [Bradyrhizobium septentrionale]